MNSLPRKWKKRICQTGFLPVAIRVRVGLKPSATYTDRACPSYHPPPAFYPFLMTVCWWGRGGHYESGEPSPRTQHSDFARNWFQTPHPSVWCPMTVQISFQDSRQSASRDDVQSGLIFILRFYCIDFDPPNLVISIKDPMPVKREDRRWGHRRLAMEGMRNIFR